MKTSILFPIPWIILGRLVFFLSCRTPVNELKFYNGSANTISVAKSNQFNDKIGNAIEFYLRDTIAIKENLTFEHNSGAGQESWDRELNQAKDKKLKLWVFNLDTLKKYQSVYTINQIAENKLTDTVFAYSEAQLDSMKWQINYFGRRK